MGKKTAKKKTNVGHGKTKITPAIAPSGSINFSRLKSTECFLMYGSLWMKEGGTYSNQSATNLIDGKRERNLCGRMIMPVNVEIKWTKI